MNLDIEKIKAAYRKWSISDGARLVLPGQEFFAGYKAALEAYDPDAIRRECLIELDAASSWLEDEAVKPSYDTMRKLCVRLVKSVKASIMSAGKE